MLPKSQGVFDKARGAGLQHPSAPALIGPNANDSSVHGHHAYWYDLAVRRATTKGDHTAPRYSTDRAQRGGRRGKHTLTPS
jgi:hypothetical protein